MPKIKNPSQGSKLYSGKIRSPLQGFDKFVHKGNNNSKDQQQQDHSEKGAADHQLTESMNANAEGNGGGSKLQMNHGRKDDHAHGGAGGAGNTLSLQEDFDKIEKLSMINANARYELINAN